MTIQGAIAELQNLLKVDDVPFYYKSGIKKVIETIQMDIPKQADDLISRADAIEAVASADETNGTEKVFSGFEIVDIIKAIPSAQPNWFEDAIPPKHEEVLINRNGCAFMSAKTFKDIQPKQGKWVRLYDNIWICNNCEQTEQFGENIESTSNYCPNCGARMTDSEKPNNCEQTERSE